MRISNHLPHFHETCLLIVAGRQEAIFYLVNEDRVNQVHTLKLEKPRLTDHEGMRGNVGGGMVSGAGAVRESKDAELTKDFTRQLSSATIELAAEQGIKRIFLFCPDYMANQIEDEFPNELRVLIEYIFYGNYHHQHAFVLLSKIQEFMKEEGDNHKIAPIRDEALSILKRSHQSSNEFKSRVY